MNKKLVLLLLIIFTQTFKAVQPINFLITDQEDSLRFEQDALSIDPNKGLIIKRPSLIVEKYKNLKRTCNDIFYKSQQPENNMSEHEYMVGMSLKKYIELKEKEWSLLCVKGLGVLGCLVVATCGCFLSLQDSWGKTKKDKQDKEELKNSFKG